MVIDATKLTVFGLPPYVFFAGIGILAAVTVLEILLLHFDLDITRCNRMVLISAVGVPVGAKLFGVVSLLVDSWRLGRPVSNIITGSGLVFYGGLLGFLLIFLALTRNMPEKRLLRSIVAVCIPLFHAFGRVGCLLAGCCYGSVTDSCLGITYTTWVHGAVLTANRFPVQLYEAGANLVLFAVLLILVLKTEKPLLRVYILSYSCLRFFDEFLRGDIHKYIGFSAAQAISLVLIAAAGISFATAFLEENGDFADPVIILGIVVLNAIIGVVVLLGKMGNFRLL